MGYVLILLAVAIGFALYKCTFKVKSDTVCVLERNGNKTKVVEEGIHVRIPFIDKIVMQVPKTTQRVNLGIVKASSKDGCTFENFMTLVYEVNNPTLYAYQSQDCFKAVKNFVIKGYEEHFAKYTYDVAMMNIKKIDQSVQSSVLGIGEMCGMKILDLEIGSEDSK